MPVTQKRRRAPRKPARKYMRKTRVPRGIRQRQLVHRFTRDINYTLSNPGPTDPFFGQYQFDLTQLQNTSDFTNLFEFYRISFVKLFFRLETDVSAQAATSARYPLLTSYNDFDDVIAPTTIQQFNERMNKKATFLVPGRAVVRTVRPAILQEIARTPNGITVVKPLWKQWLPCTYVTAAAPTTPVVSDVQHLGMKYVIQHWTTTNYVVSVQVRYYIQCKGAR